MEMVCSCLSLVLHTFSGGGTLFQSTIINRLVVDHMCGLKVLATANRDTKSKLTKLHWNFREKPGFNNTPQANIRPIKSLDCWCGDVLHAQLVTSFRWCKGWRGPLGPKSVNVTSSNKKGRMVPSKLYEALKSSENLFDHHVSFKPTGYIYCVNV